jgi:hypothetical protein
VLIVIEGISAAGKTTRASQYAPAVVPELVCRAPLGDDATVGEFWSDRHAERWQAGLALEQAHGTACFDTDPLKIHYAWCLWQTGHGTRAAWMATVQATRARLLRREIGFADVIVLLEPSEQQVREQQRQDKSRRRGNFAVHVQLREPLRHWYALLESLAPGRVVFDGHLHPQVAGGEPREDRYSVALFDAFVDAAQNKAP